MKIGGTNWAVVKTPTNNYVIVQAAFNYTNDWFVTNATLQAEAGAAIQWKGGEPVPGNLLQRLVTKTNSVETTVTASLGSSSASLNVWVIWATINILTNGPTPANAQGLWTNLDDIGSFDSDLSQHCPGIILGVQNYYTNLYLLTGNGVGYSAYGKVCIVATVGPIGVHTLVTNGSWTINQNKQVHEFKDGHQNPDSQLYSDNWTEDNPHPWRKIQTLGTNDDLYAIDAPYIGERSDGSTNSYEIHQNYKDYVMWGDQICSDTNYIWHFEAAWKDGQSLGPIYPTVLGIGPATPDLSTITTNIFVH
jgi:hypothetical protein